MFSESKKKNWQGEDSQEANMWLTGGLVDRSLAIQWGVFRGIETIVVKHYPFEGE